MGHMNAILFVLPMAMALHMQAGVSSKVDTGGAPGKPDPRGPPGPQGNLGPPGVKGN